MVSLPFLSEVSTSEAIRHCLHLLMINGLYFWRAKTEEAHLLQDPTYTAYALYMKNNGIGAKLKRLIGKKIL
jgi:hypothetical protein